MWCDEGEEEELHRIAGAIGLKRSYFQPKMNFPHYDLVSSKRALAIQAGAQEMSLRVWMKDWLEKYQIKKAELITRGL